MILEKAVAIKYLQLALLLGHDDIKQTYRRSKLGPLWITAGMAVQIVAMGIVFGLIYRIEFRDYLPFLSVSIIFWGLISTLLSDGCLVFVSNESVIKQLNIPMRVFLIRAVWRNILTFGHNIALVPVVFVAVWFLPSVNSLLVVPGFILLILNLGWMALILGLVSARFRDMPHIVNSLLTIAFYVTPVMWYPELIGDAKISHLLLGLNPFYHLLQIVRLPVLGEVPSLENWLLSLVFGFVGWATAIILFRKYRSQIPYWV